MLNSAPPLLHQLLFVLAISLPLPDEATMTNIQWIILFVSLFVCALAAGTETAFTSVSRIRIKRLVEAGVEKARMVEILLNNPNIFLTTLLILNSVAVIVASSVTTVLAIKLSPQWGDLVATLILSVVVLIFCEIAPKTAAVQRPEEIALFMVKPVTYIAFILTPLIKFLNFIPVFLVQLFGGTVKRKGPFITEDELRLLVTVGEEEGVLEEEEKEMIHSIFELADTTVREIMVPRIDMVTLESHSTLEEAVGLAIQGGQSRIPVYETTIDNIVGVLYVKDLIAHLRDGKKEALVGNFVRPAYFVPESKKLDDLLHELQQQRVHMAIVIDEYGSIAGLVTIEDLVEQIVGDIQDEYDKEEALIEKVNEHEFIIDAMVSIDDFNELMDTELNAEGYDTLGGFVFDQLGKVPSPGDSLSTGPLSFTVLSTRGRRINKVKVQRKPPQKLLSLVEEQNQGSKSPARLEAGQLKAESDKS